MDPRTSSKVTAPDLVAAFKEGTGGGGGELAGVGLERVYVALGNPDKELTRFFCELAEMGHALAAVSKHLMKGAGHVAALVVATEPPDGWDGVRDISAADE